MDDSFVKAPLAVPKLSGFDKSHQNLFTSKVGTITPIMVDELIPGSKVNLEAALNASLPPLATDTYMRCSIKCEAFFVPARLLAGGYEAWFTDEPKDLLYTKVGASGPELDQVSTIPYLPVIGQAAVGGTDTFESELRANGSLADYLGFRTSGNNVLNVPITALPFLAYHRVYHDWYRNSLVQKEVFLPVGSGSGVLPQKVAASSPYVFHDSGDYVWATDEALTLADGVKITELRQRNFGLDYFTTATPSPQQGNAQVVSFNTSGATGSFSIAALRAANSMQQFKERNNLLGNLYVEQVYGRYGVRPSDGIAQRSLYIGRAEFEVYSKGIYQQNGPLDNGVGDISEAVESIGQANPFGTIGSRYGSAYASGKGLNVNFEAKEHGYFMIMATLVPRVTYSSGVERYLRHYCGLGSLSDMANPILQNVGPQPIVEDELTGNGDTGTVFGFTDRYAEFKTKQDTLHGLVRDGQSLQAFALQRSFGDTSAPRINSAFLEIPTDYMDQVTAVKQWISDYGYWCDTYFQYRVAQPLAKYSLPSLQDPAYEHGKTIVVSKGGNKL